MIDNYGDSKVLTDFFPVVTLIAACFIMQNKLDEALHCMESNMKLLADNVITGEHTKHAVFLLNMSVIYFLKGHCEESLSLAKKAKNIVVPKLGIFHYLHGVLLFQISLSLEQTQSKTEAIKYHQEANDVFKSLQLENHPNILNCLTAVTEDEEINRPHVNPSEINFTKVMFQMVDYPFAWIDFHPSNHFIIFRADSQVWEHLEKLKIEYPFKYQWFKTWMGEFHKLGNLHQRVAKRFLNIHLEKHATAYLNDPTPAKLQRFIKFDDFDQCNDFFLIDVVPGISELLVVCANFTGKEVAEITYSDLWSFCEQSASQHAETKLIK